MRRSGKSCFFRSYSHPQFAMGPTHSQEPSWVSGVNKISEERGRCACAYAQKRKHRDTRGGSDVQSPRAPTLHPPLSQRAIITTPSLLLRPLPSAEGRTGRRWQQLHGFYRWLSACPFRNMLTCAFLFTAHSQTDATPLVASVHQRNATD